MEVKSSSRGFLTPRMTANQKELIANPAEGLMLFCTDCCEIGSLIFYNGEQWKSSSQGCDTIDFDLDGVVNSIDLDDDNDGILDVNETQVLINRGFSPGEALANWNATGNVGIHLDRAHFSGGNTAINGIIFQEQNVIDGTAGTLTFNLKRFGNTTTNIVRVEVFVNNVSYGIHTAPSNTNNSSNKTINLTNITTPVNVRFEDRTTATPSADLSLDNISLIVDKPDDDGDLNENYFDLDSDGDGCFDALEGSGTVTIADLYPSGSIKGVVGINGVPVLIGAGQFINESIDENKTTACP